MITLSLSQAKSIVRYSGTLLFVPLVLVGWFPDNKYMLSGMFILLGLVLTWRDIFTHRVLYSEFTPDADEGLTHTVTSAVSDTVVGFHVSDD